MKDISILEIRKPGFTGTLAVDSVGVGLAAFGMLNPPLAAFLHVASELTSILNSARLLREEGDEREEKTIALFKAIFGRSGFKA